MFDLETGPPEQMLHLIAIEEPHRKLVAEPLGTAVRMRNVVDKLDLLHLSMLVAFLDLKREAPRYSWRDRALVAAFALETLVGAAYLGRFVAGGSYL